MVRWYAVFFGMLIAAPTHGVIDVGITVLSVDPLRTLDARNLSLVGAPVEEMEMEMEGGGSVVVNLTIVSVPGNNHSLESAMANGVFEEVVSVTTKKAGCGAGFFDVPQQGCSACPRGFWCPDGTVARACSAGTFSHFMGATDRANCSACAEGTHLGPDGCERCPAGFYCPRGEAEACPPHTFSAEGARSAADCVCARGFVCTYGRRVTLTFPYNSSLFLSSDDDDDVLRRARMLAIIRRAIEAATMGRVEILEA